MLDHIQILGVHDKGPLILTDLKVLTGPFFLHQRVLPAAGLGALAAVGVAPGEVV